MRIQVSLMLALLALAGAVSAEVVVFENYRTDSYLRPDGIMHIERNIQLKNTGTNPIIPGELHFKLHEIKKGERIVPEVYDFNAKNAYNTELKTRKIEGSGETDLVVSVWEPVLPRFSYEIYLSYDMRFEPKGLLFYELMVPMEETTIPIRNNQNTLFLPISSFVTYSPNAEVGTVEFEGKEYRSVTWFNRRDMVVEYSKIPLPKLGVRAVNIFWVLLIISLLVLTFLLHKRIRG